MSDRHWAVDRTPAARAGAERARVLVLSRNYPSPALPGLGLWVRRLVEASVASAVPTVIGPIVAGGDRARAVPAHAREGELEVHRPRSLAGIAHTLHALDATFEYRAVARLARRLHAERPFDLIHAHFMYPDGVVAARLGEELGIPVLTTEHTFWGAWANGSPRVWRQIERALPGVRLVSAVSEAVRREIESLTDGRVATTVLHNVVDDGVFHPESVVRDQDHILFVGVIRHVKGLDVLLHALVRLAKRRPGVRLSILGSGFLRGYRADEQRLRGLCAELDLGDRVTWEGEATPARVAAAMRAASVLVVPSRRESFCSVAAEALACGMPVVATRCGGPEEIVTADDGVLVPIEDPDALAGGIDDVLDRRGTFVASRLSASALGRFGRSAGTARIAELYREVLAGPGSSAARRGTSARIPASALR